MIKRVIVCCLIGLHLLIVSEISAEEKVSKTDYKLSLDEAVQIQVTANAVPISSDYEDDPAYIAASDLKFVKPMLKHVMTKVRSTPSLASPIAHIFVTGGPVEIVGIVEGDNGLGDRLWYEIVYKQESYYIMVDDVFITKAVIKHDSAALSGRNIHHHAFGEFTQGREVSVGRIYPNFIATDYNRWRIPKPVDVKSFMDPAVTNDLQHLRLDALAGVGADELDRVLDGIGTLSGEGLAFLNGAKEHGVNEAYLIAHAFLESGRGTSELAEGVEVGMSDKGEAEVVTDQNRTELTEVKLVYNMFGIGAADSCPLECGALTAYANDWITPGDAIIGGAAWIRSGYIYNEYEQNTLYKMKWNPRMFEGHEWKQYATDIGWADKQTWLIGEIYDQLVDPDYHYDYPKYRE